MRYRIGDCVQDRFDIRALLGAGASAEVYRALDRNAGHDVVLKVPHLSIAGDLVAFNHYRREIDIASQLKHPGLQRVVSDPSEPFLVLEYIEGQSLRRYLKEHGPLPVDQVLAIGLQLTDTLEYVHQQGVVHRDVKPENILIARDGRVTLTDFGIAARIGSRRVTLSHLSDVVGTPDYMAPEQVRGERGDARTDVYALGVLLFELLTGVVPYPTGDALDATQRKDRTEPAAGPNSPPRRAARSGSRSLSRVTSKTRRTLRVDGSIARRSVSPRRCASCQRNTNRTSQHRLRPAICPRVHSAPHYW